MDGRILVVDDEPHNVTLLQRLLGRAGYDDVHTSTDPLQVEGLVRELDPDVILLDLNMPALHGRDVMARIVALELKPEIPIIVLTGDASADSRRGVLKDGAHDFISKPFDPPEVVARVQIQLRSRLLEKRLHKRLRRVDEAIALIQGSELESELSARLVELLSDEARARPADPAR